MASGWKFIKAIFESEKFEINGLNIWSYKWQSTGERITVINPLYPQQTNTLDVYKIHDGSIGAKFATTEFSYGVWGIYQEG